MRAALPMYDLPGLATATDALWSAIARHLVLAGQAGVPRRLTRPDDLLALWTAPDLLLAQSCGLPFVTLLEGQVRFVASPVYGLPGCDGPDYRSWIIVREGSGIAGLGDLAGRIAAVNAPHSQSGANALAAVTAPFAAGRAFLAGIRITGSHQASMAAVRDGTAGCAAIDCITWALLAATEPAALTGLEIIAAGPPAPALPFITSARSDDATVARLRQALAATLEDPAAAAACRTLGLRGIATDGNAYARISAMHAQSLRRGCARLATVMRQGG